MTPEERTSTSMLVPCGTRRIDTSGRVYIRNEARAYGIEEGDVIDFLVSPDDGEQFPAESPVQSRLRVSIPSWKLDRHGIEAGDEVDVTLVLPGGDDDGQRQAQQQ